jgi:predicted DNA-binding transcriptional regulator YafY
VALQFSPAVARFVREGTWSETETKEELPDGGLILRMRVPINVGLLRFVLQYGAEVEVLSPDTLRQQVVETHRAALARYADPPGTGSVEHC